MTDHKVVLLDDLDPMFGFTENLYEGETQIQPQGSYGKVALLDITRHLPKGIIIDTGVIVTDHNGKPRLADISTLTGVKSPLASVKWQDSDTFFAETYATDSLPPKPVGGKRLFISIMVNQLRQFSPITVAFRSYATYHLYLVGYDEMQHTIKPFTFTTTTHIVGGENVVFTTESSLPHFYDMDTGDSVKALLCVDISDTEETSGISANAFANQLMTKATTPGMEGVEVFINPTHAPTMWSGSMIFTDNDGDKLSSAGSASTFTVDVQRRPPI